jgi:uncharacterized metal-binding protein YceD (DUF177 family)
MTEPFSRLLLVREVPADGKRLRIEAEAPEREALARMLGIPAVESLDADLEVRRGAGDIYRVRGALRASVVQTDVVTLDPLPQDVADEIEVDLIAADADSAGLDERLDGDLELGPDVFHNGRIDLGGIVREHFALALDPYPRAAGVKFDGYVEDDPAADPSPFAVLSTLKRDEE